MYTCIMRQPSKAQPPYFGTDLKFLEGCMHQAMVLRQMQSQDPFGDNQASEHSVRHDM